MFSQLLKVEVTWYLTGVARPFEPSHPDGVVGQTPQTFSNSFEAQNKIFQIPQNTEFFHHKISHL